MRHKNYHINIIQIYFIYSGGLYSKEYACNVGDLGSIPGLGRSPGEGNGYPIRNSSFKNSMDRGAWKATVYEITKSRT